MERENIVKNLESKLAAMNMSEGSVSKDQSPRDQQASPKEQPHTIAKDSSATLELTKVEDSDTLKPDLKAEKSVTPSVTPSPKVDSPVLNSSSHPPLLISSSFSLQSLVSERDAKLIGT